MKTFICDACGADQAGARITIVREHKVIDDSIDGKEREVFETFKTKYDLCETCAKKIEDKIRDMPFNPAKEAKHE